MNSVIKAMVMAAGVGSRLDPLTRNIPKPLVPIVNQPVMDILLAKLCNIGIKDVIANTYYLSEKIINRYKNNTFGIDFSYIKEETLSGTAGGFKKCQFFFNPDDTILVLSADGLTDADIRKGIEIHKKNTAIATIGIKQICKNQVQNFGVVVTDNDGFITEFQEKPAIDKAKSNFINTGIYIFDYKIFDYIPENTFFDFAKDVFPKLLKEHAINTFVINEYWSDIGTLDQYKLSTTDVLNGKCHTGMAGWQTHIFETKLPDDIILCGYTVIGKNCKIGSNVTLKDSIIWDNVEIESGVTIENSIVCNNTKVKNSLNNEIIGSSEVVDKNLVVNKT